MMMWVIFGAMALAAALVSAILTRVMIGAGVSDIPDHRSSHSEVTPTSGGVGILSAVILACVAFYFGGRHHGYAFPYFSILALIIAIGVLGLIDDRRTVPSKLKFVLIIGLSAMAVWIIGPVTELPMPGAALVLPYWFAVLGSVLWIFVVTNGVNFMDGSNGLLGSVLFVACIALMALLGLTGNRVGMWLPIGLAGGLLGFLFFNLRNKARIFAGDVGSLTVGFGFAVAALVLINGDNGNDLIYAAPLLILPFLTDVLLTMARRLKHGENLLTPHRSHIYQRLIQSGQSHVAVALIYGLMTMMMGCYVLTLTILGGIDHPLALIGPVAGTSLIYAVLNKRLN